jgi:hypothetical protein
MEMDLSTSNFLSTFNTQPYDELFPQLDVQQHVSDFPIVIENDEMENVKLEENETYSNYYEEPLQQISNQYLPPEAAADDHQVPIMQDTQESWHHRIPILDSHSSVDPIVERELAQPNNEQNYQIISNYEGEW